MDMALEQCIKQSVVDIPAIITDIRNQRMKMVQTLVRINNTDSMHYCYDYH